MKYDQKVYFVSEGEPTRLPNGDWSDGIETKVAKWANVSDVGDEKAQILYGSVLQKSKVVRLQGSFDEKFDYIEYKNEKYRVVKRKTFRHDSAFYTGEMNG